ncbi:Probable RNA-directed DNA polymerase from transposon BS [Eumeta japonica]|uniref:Probable RNA-directed DNA polymerase from transposon BS n=1 Tax=Eumeta variegata TaxID=151549 RepID=A0A4C1VGG5_EUMVA|nr:Probable RNA-directed DNA polymerase from transposon BS [Eumeta japonica]
MSSPSGPIEVVVCLVVVGLKGFRVPSSLLGQFRSNPRGRGPKLIKILKLKKGPGLDRVNNKAIKCFSAPLVVLLVVIFNACIKNCHFPETWKKAVIIGILKPEKPRDFPTSYKPICLLSGLGTLFKKVLKARLSDHLLGNGLLI